jgi:hypothetical protein
MADAQALPAGVEAALQLSHAGLDFAFTVAGKC